MSLWFGWSHPFRGRRVKRWRRKGKSVGIMFWVPVSSARQMDTNKKNRPKATELIRERPREKKGWQTNTSLLSCLPWDRRRRKREEWRKGGGGGGVERQWGVWSQTQGSGTALHPHPYPLSSDHSHRYKRIHFSWVFPWHAGKRETGQSETEGWKETEWEREGALLLKQGSDRCSCKHGKGQ